MTQGPINLDGHRSADERRETEMRRRQADGQEPSAPPPQPQPQPQPGSIEEQMLAEPARTWAEVMEKWRFLLDRYALTPEARDQRTQKLIWRALGDMERLKKREERK